MSAPRLDAHQHFWDYRQHAVDYVWMGPDDGALKRDFLPADLAPLLQAQGLDGSIAVQARELPRETDFLLGLAEQHAFIKGIVGWLDLCDPAIGPALEAAAQHPKLKGLRLLIHDRPDTDFADSPAHVRGLRLLERHGLAYDLLLRPQHLAAAIRLVDKLPHQRFVVDHIAKPAIQPQPPQAWLQGLQELARRPNVWCKLSGLSTLGAPLTAAHFQPTVDAVLEAFGPARLMAGSDWPVSTLGSSHAATWALLREVCAGLSADEQAQVFGATCAAFYRVAGG